MSKQDQNTSNHLVSGKHKLRNAVNKITHALKPEKYTFGKLENDIIDSTRVNIVQTIEQDKIKPYLEEIATGKQTHGKNQFSILQMDEEQLQEHKLQYDANSGKLLANNLAPATTVGKISKGVADIQAFIMDKDQNIYIGTHEGRYDPNNPTLTHASFLKGKPVEMAGMISIKDGKITDITNNSGHYTPEPLDMYRGIKKLPENIFTEECKISLGGAPQKLSEFIVSMETLDKNTGIPLHQRLREDRVHSHRSQKDQIKNLTTINIDNSNDNIVSTIKDLTTAQKESLSNKLAGNNKVALLFKGSKDTLSQTPTDLILGITQSGNTEAMKTLLDTNIMSRQDVSQVNPLHNAVYNNDKEMVKTILQHPTTKHLLKNKNFNVLHVAASMGNAHMINTISENIPNNIKIELNEQKDFNGATPAQVVDDLKKNALNTTINTSLEGFTKGKKYNQFDYESLKKNLSESMHKNIDKMKIDEMSTLVDKVVQKACKPRKLRNFINKINIFSKNKQAIKINPNVTSTINNLFPKNKTITNQDIKQIESAISQSPSIPAIKKPDTNINLPDKVLREAKKISQNLKKTLPSIVTKRPKSNAITSKQSGAQKGR